MWAVNHKSQSGVALVLVMVFLLVMTVLGVSGLSRIQLDERIVQNNRNIIVAFSAAESALSDGEKWLQEQSNIPTAVSSCETTPCTVWVGDLNGNLTNNSHAWWMQNGTAMSTTLAQVSVDPRYIIEQTHFIPHELSPDAQSQGKGTYYYRVTARGTGQTTQSQSIVQSIFSVFYN
ncbi:MAG: hypothetical protein CMF48_01420 [Legionellales bacterium]|nr:hypothetical protein [Legionellales bacterium]|tara:strand:+ start:709 stop:1236 length:528 start_codon:yes stop_codon:yes gene_type:complete